MADLETGNLSPDGGFPMSLNRIRTRRESTVDDHPRMRLKLYESEKMAIGDRKSKVPPLPVPAPKPKQRGGGLDHRVKLGAQRGFRRGRKIASWLASYLSKESSQGWYNSSCNQARSFDAKVKALEVPRRTDSFRQQSSANSSSRANVPRDFKSFSHELGIGGLVPPAFPRAHSYDDLKELLGSLHIRFDAAKEVVNVELASFVGDVMDYLQKRNSSFTEEKMANELLILSQECIEMSCYQFRVKCEGIVHDLTEKRQICETGLLKWLVTRMLFILTRCTRLLQLQKDTEPIDEEALLKFTQCLESVPAVEMSWLPNQDDLDLGTGCTFNQKAGVKGDSKEEDNSSTIPEASRCRFEGGTDPKSQLKDNNIDLPHLARVSDFDGSATVKLSNESTCDSILEQEGMDGSEAVICRICEEMVPAVHLESHSYVCAHADKCDRKCLSSDKRLCNLADLLEQIIETCNNSTHSSCSSPEDSRPQPSNSQSASEGCSPKIGDWQDKSVKEMFEDLHEMDTAFMDDPHVANPMFLKGPLAIKLGTYCRNSSTGSMTSVSSTNTPRASHFDSFWLEHYKTFGIEDMHQMIDLADIARCAAATDMSENGSCEFLIACLQDLQEVLQKSQLRALVIDTFGGRIENLLREKYVLGCELLDSKGENDGRPNKSSRILSDDASHSSAISTPRQLSNKDRTSIDDFEIIKPISRGAFGKVFLARKRTTGDIFAIKVLKKLDMLRKNDIERILAERNILIAVRNPFVVRFFYSFTSRDNLYLVMEYLNGGDLYSLLRKVGCLEEDVARIYVAELVLALEYLHSLGIVHRDLKPDNILIAHDGHIKLTDFGLSKFGLMNSTASLCGAETDVIDAENRNFQQTEDESRKSAVGTPDYLAPEILLGTDHGYAADWWSVGIIVFELLTGVPPFTAECPEKIFDNILNRKIPWPSIPSEMSYAAQDLINRFLILDSDQRLGANGSSEVKEHPFFKGVNWDTLALQKAAFVPQPDTVDDTSYFLSRYGQSFRMSEDSTSSDSASECSSSCSNVELEMDEYGDLEEFDSSSQYLSLLNFSFKNLSQLASINHDVLLRSGKDSTKCSSSSQGVNL